MNERRDRGEGAVGYVGAACVGVMIVAALMSGVGGRVTGAVGDATCRIVQDGGCRDTDTPGDPSVQPKAPPAKKPPPTIYCVKAPCPQPTTSPQPTPPKKPGGTIYCFRAPCPQPTPGRPTFETDPPG